MVERISIYNSRNLIGLIARGIEEPAYIIYNSRNLIGLIAVPTIGVAQVGSTIVEI